MENISYLKTLPPILAFKSLFALRMYKKPA